MAKKALIFGIGGQDGRALCAFLAAKGYEVHGTSRSGLVIEGAVVHRVSIVDPSAVIDVLDRVQPDEIYNLAGQSSVGWSFLTPHETMDSIVLATLNMLEALRTISLNARFFLAGSSEVFGDCGVAPAHEGTSFRPCSPYGIAKAAAVDLVRLYRETYGFFACSGLMFTHESPLRGEQFVARKIVGAVARIASGSREKLALGRLDVCRDWGWAPDYVDVMWRMMQHPVSRDFVIATGQVHSLEEFVEIAFSHAGLRWQEHVVHDPALNRPCDIAYCVGDASLARQVLGWVPQVGFQELVCRMVDAECQRFSLVGA